MHEIGKKEKFSFKRIMYYVWPSMRKYWPGFVILLASFLVRIILDTTRPYYMKKIIDLVAFSGQNRNIISDKLYSLVFVLIGLYGLAFIMGRVSKYLHLKFEIDVIRDLRDFSFKKIQEQSTTFFSNMFIGSLVNKTNRFALSFEQMFDIFVYNFFYTFFTFIATFIILFTQSKFICLVFIIWIFVFMTVVWIFVKKKIRYDLEEAEADSQISGRFADVFGNNIAVKTFSANEREYSMFQELSEEARIKSSKAWFFANKLDSLQAIVNFIAQFILLITLARLWIAGVISAGTLVLVQSYMSTMFDRLWDLGNSLGRFMKVSATMQEIVDIFDIPITVNDPVNPEPLRMKEGEIDFKNVAFSYSEGREIFHNFNLHIKAGEKIGIVGHSGAGKSTMTKIILRFADVTNGEILIDGQNIRNVTQDDLHSVISYVPQEPLLFHRTIKENISYGFSGATMDEIISAAKRAHAHEFIQKLKWGYETYVGERGVKLSGGERQRIAIARAILKNAPILLLDEATSSLDSHSEALIQDALVELMKNKTTIVIAHRLSTIQKMDRIIVMEDGKIIEEGSHNSLLLNPNSEYKKLWDLQAGGFIPDDEE